MPGFNPSLAPQNIDVSYLKRHIETELEHLAAAYTIVYDILSDESRSTINWLLERTHYNTIFNKLVEDFTTKYLDKGQEQTTLQESGSSAIETSNETEQQNSPVIVIDKDEAHKQWFVRVHEKKINAQPDEWNKKLYTCLDALYDSLVQKGLMCESSKKELFIYRFSGFNIPESFNPQEKIRWEGKNVLLGYLVRCLITYTGSDAKGLGTVGTFFESKRGKDVNLATADYISKEKYNQKVDTGALQGTPWTPAQETQLRELYLRGTPIAEIARVLQRNTNGIQARVKLLGLQNHIDEMQLK